MSAPARPPASRQGTAPRTDKAAPRTDKATPRTRDAAARRTEVEQMRLAASDEVVDITLVLPVYNEVGHIEEELARTVAALEASDYVYDLDVYDDGSTDGTRDLLKKIDEADLYPRMRYIPRSRNGGSGTIRRIGSQEARGRIVVWTDADMTYPNERIPEFVQMLDDDPTIDQVVGARRTEEGTYKFLRVPAKWTIRQIASYLTGTKIPDLNSGLRAFRRDVAVPYLPLLPPGFSCVTTLTVSFLANGHEVRYEPIDYAKRAGKSKFNFVKDAYRYILQVLHELRDALVRVGHVGVGPDDDPAVRLGRADPAGGPRAPVAPERHEAHVREGGQRLLQDRERVVRGLVVDDQQLVGPGGRVHGRGDPLELLDDVVLLVEAREHDRHVQGAGAADGRARGGRARVRGGDVRPGDRVDSG